MQTNAQYHVADAYGEPTLTVLAGVGTRLPGNFSTPPVRVATEPMPEPEGTPQPEWDSLVGRSVARSAKTSANIIASGV